MEKDLQGYVPLEGTMHKFRREEESTMAIDKLKLKYLENFIADCEKNGSKILFVISPKFGVSTSASFEPAISLCNDHGYVVLNHYCDMQQMDYFKDSNHLNSKGAAIFSQLIASELKYNM